MLNEIANWTTILATAGGFAAIGYARRSALHHLRSHIGIARNWVLGPANAGWSANAVTPAITLTWSHPRNRIFPLFSGSPLSQVTLLQNVFIPETLTPHLAHVTQSIEAFNDALAQYNAFKMSDPLMYIRVERKLDAAAGAVFPPSAVRYPENMTQADLARVMATAGLTPDEDAWSDALFQMLLQAHLEHIGDATGRGLFRRLQDLEMEFARSVG